MPSTDIRKYSWYNQYIVGAADMTGVQQYLRDSVESTSESLVGSAVLSGLLASTVGGLILEFSAGTAVNQAGRLMVLGSPAQIAVASDGTFHRRSLVVLRPKDTVVATVVDPLNPPNLVTFQTRLDAELVVIPGTPAASPVYPSKQAGDVVLMGLLIPAAAASIAVSDFEVSQKELPKVLRRKIRELTAAYNVSTAENGDDIIEFNAAGASGEVTLPPALTMVGRQVTLMKVDSSANVVRLSPQGGELISGQSAIDMDSQWESVTVYATKNAWRVL